MSEYIPKYPSQEDDDSNKTSSELLAETLKPIYVPQDLMLAWESHLASYSRDTHVLLDQVKESEDALNAQYQALLTRVQKYEQMLQDITMDSNEFTMDSDVENFTGWNILAQASYWDYLLRKEITKLRDQIKSVEFKGELVADVSDSVLESLSTGNQHISNIIRAVTDSPLIRNLDAALSGTSTSLSDLRREHEALKAKQYADAIALAEQNSETFDQLTLTFNDLISEQIDRIADEAATRTRLIQELEDGIAAEAQLRYEGQEAIATQVLAIKTSTETAVAGILQEYSTIAGTNEAITTALNTYSAEVDGTIATILTDYISYANLDYALTSKTDELLAIVNDNIAKLTATNEITASLDKVKAVNTLTVDINGVVSGYGLISELENGIVKSAFGVNADTFYVGKPTDAVKPFVVTTTPTNIDGIDFPAGTWINSAIIANATIGTAHIADAAITNAKIKELDASKITTGTLEAKRIRVGDTTQFDFGFAPTDILSDAKTYTDTKTKTFTAQPTTPYAKGDIYRNGSSIYVCTTGRASGSYVAADWTLVGDVTANNKSADTAKVNGVDAATVASNAANGAAVYADVMSDLKITPVEKASINQEWNRIQKEYTSLLAQAQALGITTTAYTSAYTGLSNSDPAMSTILASMSTTTTLTVAQRDAYKTRYTTYYAEAVAITKAITDKIAANAKAQADAKAKTFTAQPVPPYSAGDLWKSGTTIKVSTVTRASGSYVAADWVLVGDVTSANTAANSNQLGGKAAATVLGDITSAKSAADSATSQLTLWKYPNTTYIDGGKIYANSITANQISTATINTIALQAHNGTFTAADGSKTVINGGLTQVYYPSGQLAVKLGVW